MIDDDFCSNMKVGAQLFTYFYNRPCNFYLFLLSSLKCSFMHILFARPMFSSFQHCVVVLLSEHRTICRIMTGNRTGVIHPPLNRRHTTSLVSGLSEPLWYPVSSEPRCIKLQSVVSYLQKECVKNGTDIIISIICI